MDNSGRNSSHADLKNKEPEGIGCGVFLILVGLGLFAEKAGWLPFGTAWFLPAVFIAWGIGEIYKAIRRR